VTTTHPSPPRLSVHRLWQRGRVGTLVLALLAYVPALTAAPGKMPADTKLFLYLDPGRLISDAPHSWDTSQFGGWVPHQSISYLWPSGPWFWAFERLGVPQWIAHRLWIGTLLFFGGWGVLWVARRLGLGVAAALVAGIVYQLSPYVLPYISRTSVMLLPWAAVGWITGLTMRAAVSRAWRDPALIALIVLTVGAVNFTALVMVAPAPMLWLVHAAWQRSITWRRAVGTALQIGALSLGVSLWWIVMLVVQGRHGADVLAYSETLADVSRTATSTESLRGLGYWLFYVRDSFAPTTSAAVDYMVSGRVLAAGLILELLGLGGLALTRWAHRRFAALLVTAGIVLAVMVHPLDDPAPLLSHLTGSSLLLALRSSTRALPLSTFGLALGAGALVTAIAATRLRTRGLAPVLVVLIAIVNLPALWNGGYVDPALERDEHVPAAWSQAAAALQASSHESRVLQLPGQEFGAFRWGYTVDPPLAGITTKPIITRDLLPLGSPGVMDLLYALDDRFQTGTVDPESIAAVARFLAVDTLWLSNDTAFERFRTERPELVAALFAAMPKDLTAPTSYGAPGVNTPAVPMLDETALADPAVGSPLPPVQLVGVGDAVPIVRVGSRTVVLAGSGDGIIDASAAGLLHGDEAVLYAADLTPASAATAHLDGTSLVILTDSNRDRAHQWRGSQDVVGFTESGGADGGVLRSDPADQRLGVFDPGGAAQQTTASLDGGLVVRASAYGEPFAYRPEDRPAMAVDGDPSTAWVVGDRGDPLGEYLQVGGVAAGAALTLLQPQNTVADRMIASVRITRIDGSAAPADVDLDPSSLTAPGQHVALPAGSGTVRITITGIAARPGGTDSGPSGVGFADLGLGKHQEVVQVPSDALSEVPASTPLAFVFTRLRTDPLDRWRSDPEPTMIRRFTLPAATTTTAQVTLRLAPRASDTVLQSVLGPRPATADRRLTGDPAAAGWAAVDGDQGTSWTSPFGQGMGATLTVHLVPTTPVTSFVVHQPLDAQHSLITRLHLQLDGLGFDVAVPTPDTTGASVVSIPPTAASTLTLTVSAIAGATTVDRRYGEVTTLPVAVQELLGLPLAPLPARSAVPACRSDLLSIDGAPLSLAVDAAALDELAAGRAVTVPTCASAAVPLAAGRHLVVSANGTSTGIEVDRAVFSATPAAPTGPTAAPAVTVSRTRTTRTATVAACPAGCWLIFGEGFDTGWKATVDSRDLGPQTQISGGFNGWWIAPSSTPTVVDIIWTPQRTNDIALLVSGLAVIGCITLGLRRHRAAGGVVADATGVLDAPRFSASIWRPATFRAALLSAGVLVASATLLISPATGIVAIAIGAVIVATRRPVLAGVAAVGLAAVLAAVVVRRELAERYPADTRWPGHFEDLHRPGLLVVALLLVAALDLWTPSPDGQ
jgi:arabinofuranan 3-O-arabinosyltransferase